MVNEESRPLMKKIIFAELFTFTQMSNLNEQHSASKVTSNILFVTFQMT